MRSHQQWQKRARRLLFEPLEHRHLLAPIAANDSYVATEDTVLSITAPGVIANDTGVQGVSLSWNAGRGNVALSSNGSFIYTPQADFSGQDSFAYRASDGTEFSNVATVTVTVTPVNDPPVAVTDGRYDFFIAPGYVITEDASLAVSSAAGVLANDYDVDRDTLTVAFPQFPITIGGIGFVTLRADGGFTYIPPPNFSGFDSFTYRAYDGLEVSNPATVVIQVTPVNDIPIAGNDPFAPSQATAFTTNEDTPLVLSAANSILLNDTDVDGPAALSAINPTFPPGVGNFTSIANGTFTYTPAPNFNGAFTFIYRAFDGTDPSANLGTVTITVNPINDPPFGINDFYNVPRNATSSVSATNGILRNDSDVDGDPLTAVDIVLPAGNGTPAKGTLTVNADGSFTYAAPASTMQVSFTYKASDGQFKSNTVTVTINIGGGPPPFAVNDSYPATEDIPLTILAPGVLNNDTDASGIPLAAVQPTQPVHGTVVLNASGGFTYTPNANFFGPDSFTYRVSDGEALSSNAATVTLNVQPINDPPVAANAAAPDATEDQTLTVNAPGLLLNVSDIDSASLTITVVTQPGKGIITFQPNGSYTYAPYPNLNGLDSFTYNASDGVLTSNTATITINVAPVNDLPVANNDTYPSAGVPVVQEDTALTVSAANGLLRNDTDADGDVLTIVPASLTQPHPASGALVVQQNSSFVYTPALHFSGTVSFTYVATDGVSNSNTATVTINVAPVDHVPVANNDSGYSTNEDNALTTTISILANDTDTDVPTAMTAQLASAPGRGTVSLNPATGQFTYTPFTNLNGPDSFTYRASDGTNLSNLATVTINIAPQPDPPVPTNDGVISLAEGTAFTLAAPGLLANDYDPDNFPPAAPNAGLSVVFPVVAPPAKGLVTLNASGSFTYVGNLNATGADSFTYVITDGTQQSSVTATVSLFIRSTGPPTAATDIYTIDEDTILSRTALNGVLSNDTDPDGNPLFATLVNPANPLPAGTGTLTFFSNGSLLYAPPANAFGLAFTSFAYRITDVQGLTATATVTININPVNDRPIANNDTATLDEDTVFTTTTASLIANDTDVETPPAGLVPTLVATPQNGTLVFTATNYTYTPFPHFFGADSFTYTVSDGQQSSLTTATVTLTVNNIQDAPEANNDNYNVAPTGSITSVPTGVLANDVDRDGHALTVNNPAGVPLTLQGNAGAIGQHGALVVNANGSFTYVTPSPATPGLTRVSFTYRASDGQPANNLSNTATVTITIAPNTPPVAVQDSLFSTSEDTPLTIAAPGLVANDTDLDGNSILAVQAGTMHPAQGSVVVGLSGSFTYTPGINFFGSASFAYRAFDGVDFSASTITVTINVQPVNDPPVAMNDVYVAIEDQPLTIGFPNSVLLNDTDVDFGSVLFAAIVTNPARGVLNFNASGSFTYTPHPNFSGLDSFTYRASDGTSSSNLATVTINVLPPPEPHFGANNDNYAVPEDTALTLLAPGVLANDLEPDAIPFVTAVKVTDLARGSLIFNQNGSFTYTPNPNLFGPDSFTYRITDGALFSNVATVTINVQAVNDPPLVTHDVYTVAEDTTLSVSLPGVLVNDLDVDGDPLTAIKVSEPGHGALFLSSTGGFTYVPDPNFAGVDSFTYRAFDGTALSSILATVTVSVIAFDPHLIAIDDRYGGQEDTALTISGAIGVLANDLDVEIDPVTALKVSDPARGSVLLNQNGGFIYTPNPDLFGPDSFTYRISDGTTFSNTATVTINVQAVNDRPHALNDSYTVLEDTALTVSVAQGLLSNDTDVESSQALVAILVSAPSHGSITGPFSGSFTYTPSVGFNNGVDSFTYTPFDGQDFGNTATVTITVQPVNDPPSFLKGLDQSVTDESPPHSIAAWAKSISAGPPDEATQSLAFTVTNDNSALFAAQPAVDPSGKLTFTPKPNASGTATVSVVLKDNGGGSDTSQPQTFTITITKPYPLHNTARPLDTNNDAQISPLDALLIINYLNSLRPGASPPAAGLFYYDTSRDNQVSPLDALLIINRLNALQTGEGDSGGVLEGKSEGRQDTAELVALLAADVAEQPKCRRGT